MKSDFELALRNWLSEALHISTLETLDFQVAFDDRDTVERALNAGLELSVADTEALAVADQLFAEQAELVLKVFSFDAWFDMLPDDHFARRFKEQHGGAD